MATLPPRLEIRTDIWIDARLALWLAVSRTLVVADLHWGYAASHRNQGNLLPMWGDEEIASRLHALIADYQPQAMIWLGDSLHTVSGRQGAEEFLRQIAVPVVILSGNHDSRWKSVTTETHTVENFFFHHGNVVREIPLGLLEVIGHHHPALGWYDGAGARLKLPALIVSSRRLVLPAFSPWAAGTPWNDSLAADETLFAIAPKRIFAVPPRSKSVVA